LVAADTVLGVRVLPRVLDDVTCNRKASTSEITPRA